MAQPLETQPVSDDRPPQLMRGFSFRSALSLAFADVSPSPASRGTHWASRPIAQLLDAPRQ